MSNKIIANVVLEELIGRSNITEVVCGDEDQEPSEVLPLFKFIEDVITVRETISGIPGNYAETARIVESVGVAVGKLLEDSSTTEEDVRTAVIKVIAESLISTEIVNNALNKSFSDTVNVDEVFLFTTGNFSSDISLTEVFVKDMAVAFNEGITVSDVFSYIAANGQAFAESNHPTEVLSKSITKGTIIDTVVRQELGAFSVNDYILNDFVVDGYTGEVIATF